MILPDTYLQALLLLLVSMICWGSWANTQKMTKDWRFELFYFDFAFGTLIAALVAAYTFGSLGFDGFLFEDDIRIAPKRKIAWALAAGGIFNLANMLLVAAISLAGMAVAFPVGIGIAFVIGVVFSYVLSEKGHPALLLPGFVLIVGANVIE
jgi:glucose uptake protein